MTPRARRLPIGAEVQSDGVSFRVWAPRASKVHVVLASGERHPLAGEPHGYFSGTLRAKVGDRYRYQLDEGDMLPDPASRYQPEGPHGPSQIVDPREFRWSDSAWEGIGKKGRVLYEFHVGTLTREGTYAAAALVLPKLASLGIDTLEMMPVHEFPGRFGWGYDGVDLYAPSHLYGTPDDLRRFVDVAHALGMGVILDVVYNHFGPDGNYLSRYSEHYFHEGKTNDWGDSIDFDGPESGPVRELFIENAGYWIDEFHFDGLRLDATQSIHDSSRPHVIAEIVSQARKSAGSRGIYVVAENEEQEIALVEEYGVDAVWNDDFHHSASVALTGRNEAYYSDHHGTPQELLSALRWGYLFQGQRYAWQEKRRGSPSLSSGAEHFVLFLENHDQVANRAFGSRARTTTSPGRWRAMTALLLVSPGTPLLFQGQELGIDTPWVYFADHGGDLGEAVKRGRLEFLEQFPSMRDARVPARVPDPRDIATFEACRLDAASWSDDSPCLRLHRDLLRLRRGDSVFSRQDRDRMHGSVLASEALLLRFLGDDGDDRLVVVNLGTDLCFTSLADPLAAPPRGRTWRTLFSSDDPSYGGEGTPDVALADGSFHFPGHAAVILIAERGTP